LVEIVQEFEGKILMKKLCAIAMLLASVCTIPALASSHHKPHISPHRPVAVQIGKASWYGQWHAGRLTANGERFNPQAMTCAHRTLPLGSVVKVTNVATGKEVALQVNDRGPYVKGRILDLSEAAARELGVEDQGVMVVRLEPISQSIQSG
jgi:peptidoglycan lytic transglycosylase